ncbi:hypothetical protein JW851_00315 [Candidatus Woesearchaeota archaeon]|nr:hypothetical protein [Candidatus Woesearchaeota archaeon]
MQKIMGFFFFISFLGFGLMLGGLYIISTGEFVLQPIEEFGLFETSQMFSTGQAFEQPTLTVQPQLQEGEMPKDSLIPADIQLYVNRIPVAANFQSAFIPIYHDDMKTFSGKFGPYDFDPRQFIGAKLCSFPKTFPDMLNCETVALNYANGYVHFARGYMHDEYIGRQALKNYGAVYFIVSPTYGNIAQSPTAIIKVVEHD